MTEYGPWNLSKLLFCNNPWKKLIDSFELYAFVQNFVNVERFQWNMINSALMHFFHIFFFILWSRETFPRIWIFIMIFKIHHSILIITVDINYVFEPSSDRVKRICRLVFCSFKYRKAVKSLGAEYRFLRNPGTPHLSAAPEEFWYPEFHENSARYKGIFSEYCKTALEAKKMRQKA